jgi:hypothetical protein
LDSCAEPTNAAGGPAHLDQILIGRFHQNALDVIQSAKERFLASFTTNRIRNFRPQLFNYGFVIRTEGIIVSSTLFRLSGSLDCRFVSRHAFLPTLKNVRILGKNAKKSNSY